jgi:hypothetical protein
MNAYSKIVDVPNVHGSLFELGSMYVIVQCQKAYVQMPQNIFNFDTEKSCIVKTCKQNLKSHINGLTCKPFSAMKQVTCDEFDKYLLRVAQDAIKTIDIY